jgi:hypothetical protein
MNMKETPEENQLSKSKINQSRVFCQSCGTSNKGEAKFCHSCGKALTDSFVPQPDLLQTDTPQDIKAVKGLPRRRSWIRNCLVTFAVLLVTFLLAYMQIFQPKLEDEIINSLITPDLCLRDFLRIQDGQQFIIVSEDDLNQSCQEFWNKNTLFRNARVDLQQDRYVISFHSLGIQLWISFDLRATHEGRLLIRSVSVNPILQLFVSQTSVRTIVEIETNRILSRDREEILRGLQITEGEIFLVFETTN